jgi:hypothetical protein
MKSIEIDPRKVSLAESDIEEWLWKNPQALGIDAWIGRQVAVPSGIIDLLGYREFQPTNLPVVVEVKNVELNAAAILQVCRYARDVQTIAAYASPEKEDSYVYKMVVFKGDVSSQLQYEANAVDVGLYSFDVSLSLIVRGSWHFSQEHRTKDVDTIIGLSKSAMFQVFNTQQKPAATDPTLNVFEEFLDKKGEDYKGPADEE